MKLSKVSILVTIWFLFSQPLESKTSSSCFESFATEFRSALVAKDKMKLARLVNNSGLLDKENYELAFGKSRKDISLRSVVMDQHEIYIETKIQKQKTSALIYFIKKSKITFEGTIDHKKLNQLTPFRDYFVCEIASIGGKIYMPEHFCFAETDVFEE